MNQPRVAGAEGTFAKSNLKEEGYDWNALATLFDAKGMQDARRDGTMNQPRVAGAEQLKDILKELEAQRLKNQVEVAEGKPKPEVKKQQTDDPNLNSGRFGKLFDKQDSVKFEDE